MWSRSPVCLFSRALLALHHAKDGLSIREFGRVSARCFTAAGRRAASAHEVLGGARGRVERRIAEGGESTLRA
ncbi:hypothetical protein DFH09DRAFT_1165133, partial [Mycena vulgaris]